MESMPITIPETKTLEIEGRQVHIDYHPAIGDNIPANSIPEPQPEIVSANCEELSDEETRELIDRNMDFVLRNLS